MASFYSAYQFNNQASFIQIAQQYWENIQTILVDRTYGNWYKQRYPDECVDDGIYKLDPGNALTTTSEPD